ncbi:Ligand-binding domain of nuclear hormone receptor [Oesophagostomum dentatum]|uniref:Ligand-binding domain of nuclear hormone receptor n=1 Tax=Oesophagostomum dentatum TaxID=61180 RepID=A0A0B1SV73_OESDE|nr:Ligand-binding domain of nuclear hormone receptor [Oesophagostomum dentatum]
MDSSSNSQFDHYRENPIKFWMVADLFLAVEYAKTFQCFANLSEADQQKLLAHAGGLLQIASQAFYTVEQKEDSITFPDGINAPYQFEKYYRETYSRPVAVIRSLSMTREQFALFKAILLFSPNDLDLTPQGRAEIDIERERLTFILRKCLLQELGTGLGAEKLANILLAIASLVDIAEKRRNYLEVCDLMSTINLSSLAKGVYLKRFDL